MRSESWKVALDALRANKVKALLTMLGMVMGSACTVMVSTVALTGQRYMISLIEAVGSNLVYAHVVEAGPGRSAVESDEITLDDLEAVRTGIPGLREAAGSREASMSVVANGREHPITILGVTGGFQRIRNPIILRGRFLDANDIAGKSKVSVLSEELAAIVFPGRDPVGMPIRIGDLHFQVVGVFRERVNTFGLADIRKETVIVPFPLMRYFFSDDVVRTLYAQAARPEDVPAVTREVAQLLKSRHRAQAVYQVENLNGILDVAEKISLTLTIILLVVGMIALVVSGIGIMNIMLVTVTERTREIGVRMAMGAQRREIRWQFLLEAMIMSGTGALLGILIAVALPVALKPFLPPRLSVAVSWISVVGAFVVTCATGILFGYLPANRAAGLQPTDSLRYE
jgi:putative ABC transport system permease protein